MKLEIENVSVAYDTGAVLHGLSLQMEEGEFLSILGPSGCGKTTLMTVSYTHLRAHET